MLVGNWNIPEGIGCCGFLGWGPGYWRPEGPGLGVRLPAASGSLGTLTLSACALWGCPCGAVDHIPSLSCLHTSTWPLAHRTWLS